MAPDHTLPVIPCITCGGWVSFSHYRLLLPSCTSINYVHVPSRTFDSCPLALFILMHRIVRFISIREGLRSTYSILARK